MLRYGMTVGVVTVFGLAGCGFNGKQLQLLVRGRAFGVWRSGEGGASGSECLSSAETMRVCYVCLRHQDYLLSHARIDGCLSHSTIQYSARSNIAYASGNIYVGELNIATNGKLRRTASPSLLRSDSHRSHAIHQALWWLSNASR